MQRNDAPSPIRTCALVKSYGLLPVLRGIDLEVDRGESLALLGANGTGKSTLLKLLAGVSRASGGELILFGSPCHPDRPSPGLLARIGYVGHEPLVYRDLTPRENLDFFARLYSVGSSAAERTARVDRAIAQVGLADYADRVVRTLSRGTLQRLAVARATLHEPELLLLDEPFTGLDEPARERLRKNLARAREAGATTILVSHDIAEVSRVASRAVILAKGKLCANLAPLPGIDELTERYRALVGDETHDVDDHS